MYEEKITYRPSAFRHKGINRERIVCALRTKVYDELMADGSIMAVGYDGALNPLEVGYREVDEDSRVVFHAMKARPQWRRKAGIEEEQ